MRLAFPAFVLIAFLTLMDASHALAEPHPAGFSNHKFNPANPVTENGVTTFHIDNHGCSDTKYGDGRGESDCYNGNVRSVLAPSRQEKLGESVEYSFDLWVDPSIDYPGYINSHAHGFIPDGRDTRLRIASWEGQHLHNFLYMLKLDAFHGVRFLSKPCFPVDKLGEWNRFSMKVNWASDKKGWIKVSCNDKVVWLQEGIATNQAPECYVTNQCEPGKKKNATRINFIPGPVLMGFGYEWKKHRKPSQFTEIQKDGITLKMRNLKVTKGARLYDDADIEQVKALQAHLNALGCDVGSVDGAAGPKTRKVALECREFEDGVLPETFDLATLPMILAAYREHYPAQ
ncbi:MAG: hypothetical protein KDJ90_04625 [Nitratireductor sp.]|nr:hypothetical protein [Nitratireductor sp.]